MMRFRRTARTVLLIAPFALGLSCGVDAPQKMSETKIVGGQDVPENQRDTRRWSTVALTTDLKDKNRMEAGRSFCTGTVIGERLIVTAAHCMQKFDANTREKLDELILPSHSDFVIHFDAQVSGNGTYVRAEKVIPHPNWSPSDTLSPQPSGPPNDIGLVVLSAPIPAKAQVAKIASANSQFGATVHLVGYGVSQSRNNDDTGTLRQVETDFSSADAASKRFSVGAFFKGACAGDSGGPAYIKVGGDYELAGATSTGAEIAGLCLGLMNNYTDVRLYDDWINQVGESEGAF